MGTNNRTIVLKGNAKGHHEEGILDTVATPGMHVTLQADGKYDITPEAIGEIVKRGLFIVKEDQLQGKMITQAYAIGDVVFLYKPVPGDHLNLFVKSGANIAVGDNIVPEGGGTGLWIEAAGTEAAYKAQALESSGGALGANTHLTCEWIGS
jgi:hypothetical protein